MDGFQQQYRRHLVGETEPEQPIADTREPVEQPGSSDPAGCSAVRRMPLNHVQDETGPMTPRPVIWAMPGGCRQNSAQPTPASPRAKPAGIGSLPKFRRRDAAARCNPHRYLRPAS